MQQNTNKMTSAQRARKAHHSVRLIEREGIRYYVKDEHTLGYVDDRQPNTFCILHGSGLRGGHNWKDGPVHIDANSDLREATLEDFADYRVSPRGHLVSMDS